jgi:hypothetical protein
MKAKHNGVVCLFPDPEIQRDVQRAESREEWKAQAWKPEDPGPCRQKPLFTGLDCWAGQENLFETDG